MIGEKLKHHSMPEEFIYNSLSAIAQKFPALNNMVQRKKLIFFVEK